MFSSLFLQTRISGVGAPQKALQTPTFFESYGGILLLLVIVVFLYLLFHFINNRHRGNKVDLERKFGEEFRKDYENALSNNTIKNVDKDNNKK